MSRRTSRTPSTAHHSQNQPYQPSTLQTSNSSSGTCAYDESFLHELLRTAPPVKPEFESMFFSRANYENFAESCITPDDVDTAHHEINTAVAAPSPPLPIQPQDEITFPDSTEKGQQYDAVFPTQHGFDIIIRRTGQDLGMIGIYCVRKYGGIGQPLELLNLATYRDISVVSVLALPGQPPFNPFNLSGASRELTIWEIVDPSRWLDLPPAQMPYLAQWRLFPSVFHHHVVTKGQEPLVAIGGGGTFVQLMRNGVITCDTIDKFYRS
ncbi:hypothetical protein K435DRAFT_837391 [Dendrothele bispora CBS 962.96]|uniref:Uncharacterized protein n=1 Tax=Dendrothele bispora (strain CBS 962.96) TaxID=1314807 RepID=A0A4S8KUF0_DENBC|nr:hypothetical protein K435DRAFT_973136 [Dendrothele bispora CBS 962.96]THV00303.1 hypothetical protein K435DRAFT_837391 [Dendrothele bispora CBS 962.96]